MFYEASIKNSLLAIWDELNLLTNASPIYRKLDLAGGRIPYTKSLVFKITNLKRKFFSLGYRERDILDGLISSGLPITRLVQLSLFRDWTVAIYWELDPVSQIYFLDEFGNFKK